MKEEVSVRQWQEKFRAGAFDRKDIYTQCKAGWYDWFCQDHALSGRLKKIAKVVMGITSPFILDNYYVWFKNNALTTGQMYDDVRFEPLSGKRDGKYFLITLDHPCQSGKWALTTERYGFGTPEFVCGNVREMLRYIDKLGAELEKEVPGPLILEEKAVAEFISSQPDLQHAAFLHRISEHTYSVFTPKENRKEFIHAALNPDAAPVGFQKSQAVQINGIYVSRHNHEAVAPPDFDHNGKKTPKKRGGKER